MRDALLETAFAQAFVVRTKRERVASQLGGPPKVRRKLLAALHHYADFEPSRARSIPGALQHDASILRLLEERGAPTTCYVISADPRFDQRRMPLAEALEQIVARVPGTIVVCEAPRLAFYEGEARGDRLLLQA